jgi:hypothetical protein
MPLEYTPGMPLTLLLAATVSLASPAPDFAAARDEAVHILQELIRIDTSNPPGN